MSTHARKYHCSAVWLVAALLTLSALSAVAANDKAFPAGTFRSEDALLTFAADGKFRLEHNGSLLVNGRYRVEGDQVTFEDEGGPMACDAGVAGRYRWTYDGKQIGFKAVEDGCTGRSMGMVRQWDVQQEATKK